MHHTEDVEKARERAIVVGVVHPFEGKWVVQDHLDELEQLADTAGAEIVDRVVQEGGKIDPAFLIRRGRLNELNALVKAHEAELVIFDDDLSPAQMRNIEKETNAKVLDRSGLILDIFSTRAKSREARTQVELAQLRYLLPRLTRQWTHLSRQVGGIGVRGPGETQLEVDRRLMRRRIKLLERELEKIRQQRRVRRSRRKDASVLALVGYTNAGKSTIMNALTSSDVTVEDRLFATLDPVIRRTKVLPKEHLLLVDTVGFIRKLPHHLVASFKSTLEETVEADILLHVVDVSHPQFEEQVEVVKQVMHDLEMDEKPIITVFNKIDRLEQRSMFPRLREEFAPCTFVSATRGIFMDSILEEVRRVLAGERLFITVETNYRHGQFLSRLHEIATIHEETSTDGRVTIEAEILVREAARLRSMLPEGAVMTERDGNTGGAAEHLVESGEATT